MELSEVGKAGNAKGIDFIFNTVFGVANDMN